MEGEAIGWIKDYKRVKDNTKNLKEEAMKSEKNNLRMGILKKY